MKSKFIFAILFAMILMVTSVVARSDKIAAPFGGTDDIAYAKDLWKKIKAKGLNSAPVNRK